MNFNHLLIFQKVAEHRHFTRAAEDLYISQPAVSKQIRELEKSLGLSLFSQIGRKIYLTEAGEILYDYARRIFALTDEVETHLAEMRDLERGRLALGASTTIGIYLLPEVLGQYRACYPRIELSLDIANADLIQSHLLNNLVELALVEGSVTHPELTSEVWQADELVLIAAPESPLAQQEALSLHDILEAPFLVREQGSGTREAFEAALTERNLPPVTPFMELGSTEAIKKAVAAGLGISFVSTHTIQLEVAAGLLHIVPLRDFQLVRQLYIAYPRQRRLSRASRAFLALLQRNLQHELL